MRETNKQKTFDFQLGKLEGRAMTDDFLDGILDEDFDFGGDFDGIIDDTAESVSKQEQAQTNSSAQRKFTIKIGGPSAQPSPSAASTNLQSRAETAAKFDAIVRSHIEADDADSLLMFDDELESFTNFRDSFDSDKDFVDEAYSNENITDEDVASALAALQENDLESAFLILKQKLGESIRDNDSADASSNDTDIFDGEPADIESLMGMLEPSFETPEQDASEVEAEDDMSWMDDVFVDPEHINKAHKPEEDEYAGLEFAEYDDKGAEHEENVSADNLFDDADFAVLLSDETEEQSGDPDTSDAGVTDLQDESDEDLLDDIDRILGLTNDDADITPNEETLADNADVQDVDSIEPELEEENEEELPPLFDYETELALATAARDKQMEKDSAYAKREIPEELYVMSKLDLSDFPELDEKNKQILQDLVQITDKEPLSEIAYAYTEDGEELPAFIPPMKENSLKFKELDEVKEILGVCICGEISYGIYTTSQQELSQDALFDEDLQAEEIKWSPDALKAVPMKALFGCYDDQVEKVIAVSPTFLTSEELVGIKQLIMEGATLLINALPAYDFGEEPMYATFNEMNSAICQSDKFEYQAKVYALAKLLKDKGLCVPLVSSAVLELAGDAFGERCRNMLTDVSDAVKTEKRSILFNDSNEIRMTLPRYANDASDDDFSNAKGLLEVASKILENDHLSHSGYYSERYVDMVTELLSLNKFQSYFDGVKNKVSADILFSEL